MYFALMLIKLLIVIVLAAILVSLGSGLYFLVKDGQKSRRTVTALTIRISLSVALFVLLIVAYFTGMIAPHGALPMVP